MLRVSRENPGPANAGNGVAGVNAFRYSRNAVLFPNIRIAGNMSDPPGYQPK